MIKRTMHEATCVESEEVEVPDLDRNPQSGPLVSKKPVYVPKRQR